MSTYVNLLNDNEIHYHSVASDSRAVKYAAIGAGALVALLLVLGITNYSRTTSEAAKLKARWEQSEPTYEKAIKNKQELKTSTEMLSEIKGWPVARLETASVLRKIQSHVPEEMQITRMNIQGSIEGIDATGRRDRTSRAPIKQPQRLYNLRIEGVIVTPEDGYPDVIVREFVKILQSEDFFTQLLEEVDTLGADKTIVPHFETGKEQNGLRFTIQCQFKPRKIQWTGKA